MTHRHLIYFLVAIFGLTAGGTVAAQGPVAFFASGHINIVRSLAVSAVQRDLGVSAEVARDLKRVNDDYIAAYQEECKNADIILGRGIGQFGTLKKIGEIMQKLDDEFLPKANELLSADQQVRFQQLLFQNEFRNRGPAALLDVATELKLTDEQRDKLNALDTERREQIPRPGQQIDRESYEKVRAEYRNKAIEILSAEQKVAFENLKGRDFETSQLNISGAPPRRGK